MIRTRQAKWVGTLSGVARDRAASIYSNVVVQRNPAAAMTWALSIGDSSLRDRSIQQVASLRKGTRSGSGGRLD